MTVTSPRHALYGQRLEVLKLISDRGATWVTVRVPNGSHRNIKRMLTDLAQPLPDSKSSLIVSASVLLRVAKFVDALSRRGEEETGDDKNDVADTRGENAVSMVKTAGADPSTASGATGAGPAPEIAQPRRG